MASISDSDFSAWDIYQQNAPEGSYVTECPLTKSHLLVGKKSQKWVKFNIQYRVAKRSFLPEASFGLRVLSSPASVCPCVCVYQSRACPHDNSSPIQARITKFRTEMQNTLVEVPIVFGEDRPWSSRSNLTWKSNFTSFWACSHHYSSNKFICALFGYI